ncbi:MAG: hypothetical protein GTO61_13460 [Gemmatimonadales bacterium]|nr:hypothetical protein [Gemmatimonadales bacterium]
MQRQQRLGWARVWAVAKPKTDPMMRQGAWYPVLGTHPNHVALQVYGRRVVVRPQLVEIREEQPVHFTVVYRLRGAPNPARGTSDDVGPVYGVCPKSADRVRLFENAALAECPRCGYRGQVAWWETG